MMSNVPRETRQPVNRNTFRVFACMLRDQKAVGSNPVTSITLKSPEMQGLQALPGFLYIQFSKCVLVRYVRLVRLG